PSTRTRVEPARPRSRRARRATNRLRRRPRAPPAGRRPRPGRARGADPLAAAEAAPAAGVVVEGGAELLLAEVGPKRVDEDELGVGELPQEKVRDPQLAGRADEQVWIRHLGRDQVR